MNDAPSSAPGRLLGGRYHLDVLLARGGMAEVWQATDQVLGRAVAVKILHPHLADDDGFRARFRSEAVAVARLVHPSIVAIYDTCNDDGTEAIVMELVRGRTLREFLDERGGRLDPVEVVHIGADVAAALTCAHRAGIVHRDMKPANILLSDDGRVLVTDFGIAKVLDQPDVTQTSTLLGTVKYLAPEQVEGAPVDARTDVYALGAVLYEALCGSPPFSGDNPAALALRRLQHDPPPLSDRVRGVPVELDGVVQRALARRPADRFGSADELRSALLAIRPEADPTVATAGDTWSNDVAAPVPPTPGWDSALGAPADPPTTDSRRPTAMIVSGVLVTLALVLVALLVSRTEFGEDLLSRAPGAGGSAPSLVAVSAATSFDPQGVGTPGEHEATVGNVIDAEPSTTWNTETYPNRSFGNLKTGVGVALTLPEVRSLERIRVNSPTRDWGVEVYVAGAPAPTLSGWGDPVARADGIDGDVELDLAGRDGGAVLVWITDLGSGEPFRVTFSDVLLAG